MTHVRTEGENANMSAPSECLVEVYSGAFSSRVNAERFYWAKLHSPPAARSDRKEALRFAFESWIPAPLDDTAVHFIPLSRIAGTHSVIACGIDRRRLAELIDEAEVALSACNPAGSLVSLRPASLPQWVDGEFGDGASVRLEALEFRRGTFEHPRRRQRRRRATSVVAICLVVSPLLLAATWVVTGQRHLHEHRQWREVADSLARSALRSNVANATTDGADPRWRILSELRTLRQATQASAEVVTPEDRLDTLVHLLEYWPNDIPTLVRTLSLEQDSVSIRGEVRDPSEYERLAAALAEFDVRWTRPVGHASRSGNGYTFSMTIRKDRTPTAAQRLSVQHSEVDR